MEHIHAWLHNYFLASHGGLVDEESQNEYIDYMYGDRWKQNTLERFKCDTDCRSEFVCIVV